MESWIDVEIKKASEFLSTDVRLLPFFFPNSEDNTIYLGVTDRVIDEFTKLSYLDGFAYFYDHACDLVEKLLRSFHELKEKYQQFTLKQLIRFFEMKKREQLYIGTSHYLAISPSCDFSSILIVIDLRGGGNDPLPKEELQKIFDRFKENLEKSSLNRYVTNIDIIGSFIKKEYHNARDIDIVISTKEIKRDEFMYRLYEEVIVDQEMEQRLDIFFPGEFKSYKKNIEKEKLWKVVGRRK